jgi:hypothetical protein
LWIVIFYICPGIYDTHKKHKTMKKICIGLTAIALMATATSMATGPAKIKTPPAKIKTPEERAEARTKIMTCELKLTAEEVPKVYAVNLHTVQRLDSAIQKLQDHPARINKEGIKLDKERDIAMRRTMTADQYSLYLKIEDGDLDAMKSTVDCRGEKKK